MTLRAQFPMLKAQGEKPLAFLDSAATTHKPKAVIDALNSFYSEHYSSVKRGNYQLSAQTTQQYENARQTVADFFQAQYLEEIIFTRGTTESINLVAWSWGLENLEKGDEIIISALEHHANIVPWQLVARQKGAKIKVLPCDDSANLQIEILPKLLNAKTKMVAVNHIANSTGTINPLTEIIALVRKHSSALVLVDGAQSAPHIPVNLTALDVDFFACSGHKIYGPTGIGMLYGKKHLLTAMPPWQGGGEMIESVNFDHTSFAEVPDRFEAGTPNIAGVLGFKAALEWVKSVGIERIASIEKHLLDETLSKLQRLDGFKLLAHPKNLSSLLSFNIEGINAHDVAMILDEENVAVRAGHHCAQPVMDRFKQSATLRVSFGAYNESWEIDRLISALQRSINLFK
ncbi:MAG: cysteine desulfurase [Fibrobacter sp.]|nr:cysteine desulfurase [Fibrobacter sp.]